MTKTHLNLFGEDTPEPWMGRGRPPHVPTAEKRNKVMVLLALGWTVERIARALSITPPTLRKNYFRELKARAEARDRVDAGIAATLWQQAMTGKVAAIREFRRFVERQDILSGQDQFYRRDTPPAPETPSPRVGKKEQAALDAASAGTASDWGDDLRVAPPRPN